MLYFLEACPTKLIFLLTLNFLQFSEHGYAKLITSVTLHMIFLPLEVPCLYFYHPSSGSYVYILKDKRKNLETC